MASHEDEELEEGHERCPICDRLNCPGANDHCEHYFGNYWDGQVMWSGEFERFATSWGELQGLVDEDIGGDGLQHCRRLAVTHGVGARWFSHEIWDNNASAALVALLDFEPGPYCRTGGMAGGSGYSLYLSKMDGFEALVAQIDAFVARVRDAGPCP